MSLKFNTLSLTSLTFIVGGVTAGIVVVQDGNPCTVLNSLADLINGVKVGWLTAEQTLCLE